jgi:hypothetical protein
LAGYGTPVIICLYPDTARKDEKEMPKNVMTKNIMLCMRCSCKGAFASGPIGKISLSGAFEQRRRKGLTARRSVCS